MKCDGKGNPCGRWWEIWKRLSYECFLCRRLKFNGKVEEVPDRGSSSGADYRRHAAVNFKDVGLKLEDSP